MPRPALSDAWWYVALALPVAIAFALLTPPFQSPDEVAHYWRSAAISRGNLIPDVKDGRPYCTVPVDARDLVAICWAEMAGKDVHYDRAKLREAWRLRPRSETVQLSFPAFYTAIAYAPQSLAVGVSRLLRAPTLAGFYAGRIANGLAGVLLVALAMWLSPQAAWIFGIVGLTPMFLFLGGSYSADVVTTGLACCVIAAGRNAVAPLASALLALAKPGYALIPFIASPRLRDRSERLRIGATLVVTVLCAWLAAASARTAYYQLRGDVPTDASAQLKHVVQEPLRFVSIAAKDYVSHAAQYRDQLVGRLGWLDVGLPPFVIWSYVIVFLYVALSTSISLKIIERLTIAMVAIATLLILSLSQYLVWTAVGSTAIEGLQGRYFLPVVPLVLLAISARVLPMTRWVPLIVAACGNVIALLALSDRYYGL
jgi:uncharacterized membrane protein